MAVSCLSLQPVLAHGSGPPYLLVNGQYAQTNPIQGLAPGLLALDSTTETFVAGEPIQFEIDLKNLGFKADIRWKWGKNSATFEEGTKVKHTYDKPGSYFVVIQAKGPSTGNQFTDYNSVQINVVPTKDYVPPSAKVGVDSKVADRGWQVEYQVKIKKDPSASIKSYQWFLGDGTRAQGEIINHVYQKGFYQAFPLLIITDSNGLTTALAFEVNENNNQFKASSLPFAPNTIDGGVSSRPSPIWVVVPLAILGIIVLVRRKKKLRSKKAV